MILNRNIYEYLLNNIPNLTKVVDNKMAIFKLIKIFIS